MTAEGIFAAGAQRISLGSWVWAIAKRTDLASAMEVMGLIRDEGDFSVLAS